MISASVERLTAEEYEADAMTWFAERFPIARTSRVALVYLAVAVFALGTAIKVSPV